MGPHRSGQTRADVRPVSVTTGRHPYEVAVHAAAVACGLALAVTDRLPRSAAEAMPDPVQALWVVLLIASGTIAITGAFWRGPAPTALRVEMAGVLLLGVGTSMYAIALVAISGEQATAAGSFLAGITVASWWRAGQIVGDLRRLAAAEDDR